MSLFISYSSSDTKSPLGEKIPHIVGEKRNQLIEKREKKSVPVGDFVICPDILCVCLRGVV